MLTTPAQTLTLHMDQASLNNNCGPQQKQSAKNVWITVNCRTFWIEPLLFESLAKQEKVSGAFIDTILSIDQMVSLAIQRSIHPAATMQERTIEDNILSLTETHLGSWRMLQPIVKNPLNRCATMAAEHYQLVDREALCDPTPEPNKLSLVMRSPCRPREASTTCMTDPSLVSFERKAVALSLA
jgi:hypothetical protein